MMQPFDLRLRDADAAQIASTTPQVARWLFRLFGRQINQVVNRVLLRAYERGTINSTQMHTLCAQFDPTQSGVAGKLSSGL